MARVTQKSLVIPQGETYRLELTLVDSAEAAINLTNYTARCQFRSEVASTTTLMNCATEGDYTYITLGGAAGTLLLTIPAAVSAAWEWTSAVYDIEIIDASSNVKRVLQGSVIIDPEVTR